MSYVYSPRWSKYNLCIDDSIYGNKWHRAFIAHEMVCDYLDNHPEISYKGEYFKILSLAEKEMSSMQFFIGIINPPHVGSQPLCILRAVRYATVIS